MKRERTGTTAGPQRREAAADIGVTRASAAVVADVSPESVPAATPRACPPGADPATYQLDEVTAAIKPAGYLCVRSHSDPARPNAPVLAPTNPLGSLLLASGVMPAMLRVMNGRAALMESLARFLPVAMVGVEVHEELHRFEVDTKAPARDGALVAANRLGEAVGSLRIRWLIAPDDFEPAPGKVPPPTPLDPARSQRFVMLDGRMAFNDSRQSGLRGFGVGRTYPITVDGRPQLRLAATVDVLEGYGNLKGLPGAIAVNGYVAPPQGVFISFVGRFADREGQLRTDRVLAPLVAAPDPDPETTFLTLIGEADPDHPPVLRTSPDGRIVGSHVVERLRLLSVGFDLDHAAGLRTRAREGAIVGRLTAALDFDPTDPRPESPIRTRDGVFMFVDARGREIGSLQADVVEGKAVRDGLDGRPVFRLAGFGPLREGTGAFAGAVGMMSLNGVASVFPRTLSNLYMLRISDPDGRFRAAASDAAAQGAGGMKVIAAASDLRFVEGRGTTVLAEEDRSILSLVPKTLADGVEIQRWFEEKDARGTYAQKFEVIRQFTPEDQSFGFFDTAVVGGQPQQVMGIVQEMLFDRSKQASAEHLRKQFREFVLRYFMRVCHFQKPEAMPEPGQAPPSYLRAISWLPEDVDTRVGFGYRQLLYKLRESGLVGKFHKHEEFAMADLRELGRTYDWTVLKVNIFDFNLTFAPFGGDSMKMVMPLKEETYLVLAPEFIVNREDSKSDVLGEYGYGYAFVPYAPEPGMIAYGPGHFSVAYQSVRFRLHATGDIRVRAAFVVNRPDKIVKLDVDPLAWSVRVADLMTLNLASRMMAPMLAIAGDLPLRIRDFDPFAGYIAGMNFLTAGLAEQQLGISKTQLEKRMLVQHFMQHYEMLVGALLVWRKFSNWADPSSLPAYCQTGVIT